MSTNPREALLRRVLLVNGIVSGVTGLLVFVFAGAVDGLLGSEAPAAVRVVGGGLAVFAATVYATSRSAGARLSSGARTIMILDLAWVVASLAAVVSGWFGPWGNVVVLAVAAVVGAFAIGEAVGISRQASLRRPPTNTVTS